MESSTVLAFRIFVMLSCLIIVPMAAIFGSAFPDVVKTQLVDRVVAWGTGKPYEPNSAAAKDDQTDDAPAPEVRGERDAPRWGTPDAGARASNPFSGGAPVPQNQVVPAGGQALGAPQANLAVGTEGGRPPGGGYPLEQASAEAPLRGGPGDAPAPIRQSPNNPPMPVGAFPSGRGAPQSPEQPDGFTQMERRLREYGASYYLLETWGNEGELYRFHCRMAISNNPNFTRHFEATDRDALRAMAQVLQKIETWRAGRQP